MEHKQNKKRKEIKQEWNHSYENCGKICFCDQTGAEAVIVAFDTTCDRINLPHKIKHSLRHTFIECGLIMQVVVCVLIVVIIVARVLFKEYFSAFAMSMQELIFSSNANHCKCC